MIPNVVALVLLATAPARPTYYFGQLTTEAGRSVAAPRVQAEMRKFARRTHGDGFELCVRELGLSEHEQQTYFTSVRIPIGHGEATYFLVLPSRYCSRSFFGAHTIAFWILSRDRSGKFALLHGGSADYIEVLHRKTNRLHDLRAFYDQDHWILRFDGRAYRTVSWSGGAPG